MSDLTFLEEPGTEISANELSQLTALAQTLVDVRVKIASLEESLAVEKELEKKLSEVEIPAFMTKLSVNELALNSGARITIKEELYAAVPKDATKRMIAMDWLSAHGGGELIKDVLTVQDPEERIIEELEAVGATYERNKDVNTNSLKAFFKEALGLKKGSTARITLNDVAKELNVYIQRVTKVAE